MILLTLPALSLAQAKKFDYKGAVPGATTLKQFKAFSEQSDREWPACVPEEKNTTVCSTTEGAEYHFVDDLLAYIELEVGDQDAKKCIWSHVGELSDVLDPRQQCGCTYHKRSVDS
ncbi:MAG: hypothetical protein ACHP7P_11535 [Terriglobales bacterium]